MLLFYITSAVLAVPFTDQLVFGDNQCPPKGLDSVQNFNISRYISAPWYVQYQEPNAYQTRNNLYCVRAQYAFKSVQAENVVTDALLKFFRWIRYGPGIQTLSVMNYANYDKVNGKIRNGEQQGVLLDPKDSSKLLVGPSSLLPRWFYGPYYVMWVDSDYQSAIVSGGLPEVYNSTTGLCQTRSSEEPFNFITNNGNKQGLWFFTRQKVANVQHMFSIARDLGYETGRMLKVQQENCLYEE